MSLLWSLSVLSCWFLQTILLFGYSWRNRYNVDSHFKTNNRKNECERENNCCLKIILPLKPLSWCKLFQVLVCPSPDQVSSRTDIYCSYRPLWVHSKNEEMTRKMVFTRMLLLCNLLYTLLPIAQFHLWFQRKTNLERCSLCSAITDWSQQVETQVLGLWALCSFLMLGPETRCHGLTCLSEMIMLKVLEKEPVWLLSLT